MQMKLIESRSNRHAAGWRTWWIIIPAEESGETGAALLRIWRGNMVLVIVSLAVMAVLVWMG